MFCPPTLLLHSATPSGSLVSEAGSDSWGGGVCVVPFSLSLSLKTLVSNFGCILELCDESLIRFLLSLV